MADLGSSHPPSVLLLLTQLMLRSSLIRRIAAGIALISALLVAASAVVASLTLANIQGLERDLGSFEYATQVPIGMAPGDEIPVPIAQLSSKDAAVVVTSPDLRLAEQPQSRAQYVEADWAHNPLPDRYRLLSGRWPLRSGEVATTTGFGATVHVFADVPLQVVGTVLDRFDRNGLMIAAGAGTWATWRVNDLADRFPNSQATATYLWSGPADPVLDVLAAAAGRRGESVESARQQMSGFLFERERYLAADKASAADRFPLVLGLPAAVVPLITGGLGGGLIARWTRRMHAQLTQVGVPQKLATAAQLFATMVTGVGGGLAGCLLGQFLGWAFRPVLDSAANQPIAPFAIAWGDLTLVMGGILVGLLAGSTSGGSGWRLPNVRGGTTLRRVSAGIAALALISQLPGPDDGLGMSVTFALFALVTALLAPVALNWVARRIARRGPATQLGVAMLEPRQHFASVVVIMLTLVTSLAGGALAISTGQLAAADAKVTAAVPTGYALLRSWRESAPVPAEIQHRFESLIGTPRPIVTWDANLYDISRGFQGLPLLFESREDIERWIGHPLTKAEAAALNSGAIGLAQPATEPVSISPVEGQWVSLASIEIVQPRELAANYGGILLEPRVRPLRLTKVNQQIFYAGLSPEQQALLPNAAAQLGIEPGYIVYHQEPQPYALPQAFVWALVALSLIAATLLTSLATSQAKALRPQLASLTAIGLPRTWVAKVLGTQVGLVAITSGFLALLTVVVGNAIVWVATPEALTPLPNWIAIGAIAVITLTGSVAALPTGLLTLRPIERSLL